MAKERQEHIDPEEQRQAVLKDISDHLAKHGNMRWSELFAKHPGIGRSTMWRYIAKVRTGEYTDEEMLVASVKKAKRVAKAALPMLPAAPSPGIIASGGKKVTAAIDFMAQVKALIDDVDMLRDWSMTMKDGKPAIKNAMYFSQAIKLRIGVLETALRSYQEIYDLRKMEDFYNTIIETIASVDPQVRDLIMEKLEILNNSRGLTIDAKISAA